MLDALTALGKQVAGRELTDFLAPISTPPQHPPPPRGPEGHGAQGHAGGPLSPGTLLSHCPYIPKYTQKISAQSAAWPVGQRVAKQSVCRFLGTSETRTLKLEVMWGCDLGCAPPPPAPGKIPRGRGYSPDQGAQREARDQGQGPPVLLHLLLLLPPARRRHILPAAATAEAKMEEPEREDGSASPKGCGAGGAAPRRPACRPPSPKGPRGRFTGGLRGLPLLPRPPARRARLLQPPPPPQPPRIPRPPRLSLRAARDQRPQRTRPPTANHRRGRDTSHTAELEAAASPTSRGALHSTGPRAGHAPSDVSGGGAWGRGGRTQSARAAKPPPRPPQVPPNQGLAFRKSARSPGTLSLLPYKGPPLRPGRAEFAQGLLGIVV